ncbi:uncharacterized protein LY89DRAFT_390382 [Mollisia scopiformis]|uniref:Uncharacterized protein n=1 Tax=Mollisia scopiformis TaxID=149040 RepID=A0A194XPH1_MOLSC|nr:uncharacterized protein LY89DRAFT_390382 [Mollisia scopiformis]KUJ21969.1 hypothetical protein LY89DRAFT_390382 [Mollisia scopiformis]
MISTVKQETKFALTPHAHTKKSSRPLPENPTIIIIFWKLSIERRVRVLPAVATAVAVISTRNIGSVKPLRAETNPITLAIQSNGLHDQASNSPSRTPFCRPARSFNSAIGTPKITPPSNEGRKPNFRHGQWKGCALTHIAVIKLHNSLHYAARVAVQARLSRPCHAIPIWYG